MVTEISSRRWLEEAVLNRRWFDVIIFAGGKQYKAHKIILSSASPFLRGVLLSRSSEDYSCIVLADVTSDTVELLLQYVYTGEVSLVQEQVESFIALAKVLQLHIDKDVMCEDKHKLRESDTININQSNSVLQKILSEVNVTNKKVEDKFKIENKQSVKYETSSCKNFDVEVLIKSDKISKCSMNGGGKNFAPRQNNEPPEKFPKICEFYKKMQYFGRTFNDRKSDKFKSETVTEVKYNNNDKTRIDDECCSTSSCEVIDTSVDNVSSSNTKHNASCDSSDRIGTALLRQSKQHRSLSPPTSPNNSAPLNLMSNLHRSPDSQNYNDDQYRNIIDYRVTSSDRNIQETNRHQQEHLANSANHRLVKPIPSLMPIGSRINLDQNLRTSPTLLDLSAVRRKLNRNVHSAFQEVNRYSFNKYNVHSNYTNHSSTNPHNVAYTAFHNNNNQSFRTPRTNTYQTENLISTCHNNEDRFPISDRSNVAHELRSRTRILPRNRAISGPWCTRSPTYYKPGRRTVISPPRYTTSDVNNIEKNVRETQNYSHLNAPQPLSSPEKSSVLNITERSNDSNNNFDTVNCNTIVAKTFHHKITPRDNEIHLEDNINGVYNKQLLSATSPRSTSATSPGDEEVYRTPPEDDYRSFVDHANFDKLNKQYEKFSTVQNKTVNNIDSDLSVVKTEDFVSTNDNDLSAFKCEFCSKVFTSKESLAIHSGSHTSRARYKCDQCDKCFSQLRNYKYHVSVHRGTKEFAATCNVCGKYFNDRGYLSSHMKIHRNRKEYQCPHCPKSFNQRVAYNMHVRIHTGIKPHQCEECGKAFSRKMLLKQHARTHSGEKPYACTSCGKRFADRSNMTLHMRLHSGVKPFSCTLCPKSFTKKHHLKTHLNYHTGNKPYACAKCGLTFSQSSNMRTHMKKCTMLDSSNIHDVQQHTLAPQELTAT